MGRRLSKESSGKLQRIHVTATSKTNSGVGFWDSQDKHTQNTICPTKGNDPDTQKNPQFYQKYLRNPWLSSGGVFFLLDRVVNMCRTISKSTFGPGKFRNGQSHLVLNCKWPSLISSPSGGRFGPGPMPEKKRRENIHIKRLQIIFQSCKDSMEQQT